MSPRIPAVPSPSGTGPERLPFERLLDRVTEAEFACEARRYGAALAVLQGFPLAGAPPSLVLRAMFAESWACMSLGRLDEASARLERARALAETADFTDADRAEAVFRLGCCRLCQGQVANAAALLSVALELSGPSPSEVRARIHFWRARCYQRQRDWDTARIDVQSGLEIAELTGNTLLLADFNFQAAAIAEREKQWVLARFYAEQALAIYEEHDDRLNMHRTLNNLGGINFLLGELDQADSCLAEAVRIASEIDDEVGTAYARSSLAQVQLRTGRPGDAAANARQAIGLLAGRADHAGERGNAEIVLGRALLEQGREAEADERFRAAEQSFERFGSVSHIAAAWIAQGDLAAHRGDLESAAARYRAAADALQDLHF